MYRTSEEILSSIVPDFKISAVHRLSRFLGSTLSKSYSKAYKKIKLFLFLGNFKKNILSKKNYFKFTLSSYKILAFLYISSI
jgi:hypothetical protein